MPPVLIAAAAAAGGALLSASTLSTVALVAANVALATGAALLQAFLRPRGRPRPTTADRTRTITSAVEPARWILGRARTGGVLVFFGESNSGADAHLAIVLSEGACEGIERVWIGSEELLFRRNGRQLRAERDSKWGDKSESFTPIGSPATGKEDFVEAQEPRVVQTGALWVAYENFAADGTQGAELRTVFPDQWSAEHKLNGLSWLHIRLRQPSGERVWSGFPRMSFLVKGIKVTYPGQETAVWTENAAALRYWWLTQRRMVPQAAIDEASVRQAITLCDEAVTIELPSDYSEYTNSSKRYTVNGLIQSEESPEEIESQMDFAWQGYAVEFDGNYFFRPGVDRTASLSIPESAIVGVSQIQPAAPLQQRVNAASIRLGQSADNNWIEQDLPTYTDTALRASDGGVILKRDLGSMRFVVYPVAALRILATFLKRARSTLTMTYTLSLGDELERLGIKPGDIVLMNDGEYFSENRRCLVVSTSYDASQTISLNLMENPTGWYADNVTLPGLMPRALGLPGTDVSPATPSSVTAVSGSIITSDGNLRSVVEIGWLPTPYSTSVTLSHRNGFTQTVVTRDARVTFDVSAAGAYLARVALVDRSNLWRSSEVQATAIVGYDELALPRPEVVSAEPSGRSLRVVIANLADRDVSGIEIRYRVSDLTSTTALPAITEANWLSALRMDVVSMVPAVGSQPLLATAELPGTGRYRVFVRLVNRHGGLSPIDEVGYVTVEVPAISVRSHQQHPLWPGLMNKMYVAPGDDLFLLRPDRSTLALTANQWEGREGWPFGSAEVAAAGSSVLSETESTWYETAVIDLGDAQSYEIAIDLTDFEPPGSVVATQTGYQWYLYRGTTTSRGSFTRVGPFAGTARQNHSGFRYIVVRLHLTTWRGAAVSRLAIHARKLVS